MCGLRYDDSCLFSVLKDQGLGLRGSRFLWHSHSTPPGEVQGENGRVSGRFKLRLEVWSGHVVLHPHSAHARLVCTGPRVTRAIPNAMPDLNVYSWAMRVRSCRSPALMLMMLGCYPWSGESSARL